MATRTIDNWKDRLITIMVTPFMTCSARLPVYTILIALAVPSDKVFGFFNLQGIALMVLYLLGFVAALVTAWLFNRFSKLEGDSSLILEMPDYKMPRWSNVGITIFMKSKTFVVEAGKVIFAISILLWVLSTFGPNNSLEDAQQSLASSQNEWMELAEPEQAQMIQSWQLEHSYAGILGKFIEPVIKPLGYDWKIGIALITSFAAREVFVGTIATIYSVGGAPDDERSIRERMKQQKRADGTPVYTLATAVSLLLFYAFAMQCMSTVAVVARETNSWKWPTIQLVFMTVLAYLSAFIAYQSLS
jgi:ferrous iron transport protein B